MADVDSLQYAVIVTPHPLHASMAMDCLRAGCHALLEKPMPQHSDSHVSGEA